MRGGDVKGVRPKKNYLELRSAGKVSRDVYYAEKEGRTSWKKKGEGLDSSCDLGRRSCCLQAFYSCS